MWQSRRWRFLLNVIDHLPRDSWYSQAVANDDEHAEMLLAARERAGAPRGGHHPPMQTWSAEVEHLVNIEDRLGTLITAVANANGARAKLPPPAARPQTAMDRVVSRQRMNAHEALVARVKRDSAAYAAMMAEREAAAAAEAATVDSEPDVVTQD